MFLGASNLSSKTYAISPNLYRIMKKRDANNEVPANFNDFMNMWSFESITCIALNVRLGILNANYHDENAEKLIQVKYLDKIMNFQFWSCLKIDFIFSIFTADKSVLCLSL